ncbi:MAG TPA: GAF domain-containing sensor histidine kinase [Fimbriimonadaceae bacterium]|nr:GAF domain-containing sensor histidine kinase [Fimbriimonadaceae bacterium]
METNDQLIRAVQVATRKLASSGKFDLLLKDVLAICVEAVGATGGTIYLHDPAAKRLRFRHVLPEEIEDKLPQKDVADDFGMVGRAFQTRKTICQEFPEKSLSERNTFEQATGVTVQSMVACPLMMEDEEPIGVVQLLNKLDGAFNESDVAVLETVAGVSTMAYLNYRLTDEASRASTLLGMGKVSHDIGNLAASLFATLSYSGLAMDGLKSTLRSQNCEQEAQDYVISLEEMHNDLQKSVDRIVGYSRLISDLSAGRELRPNKVLAPLADTIQTSAAYLETEGRKNHVALRYEIQYDAPALLHDELYLFRIVQNLVGNAIKAVKETIPDEWAARYSQEDEAVMGEVTVRYYYADMVHTIEVTDSGPGMSKETAERILAGNARSQWDKGGGSGWGTKIVLELAATHSAKVSIDSEPGKGSTFRVAFPHVGVARSASA